MIKRNEFKGILILLVIALCTTFLWGIIGGYHRDGSVSPPIDINALPLKVLKEFCFIWIPFITLGCFLSEYQKWYNKKKKDKPSINKKYFRYSLSFFLYVMLIFIFVVRYMGIWGIDYEGHLIYIVFRSWREALPTIILYGVGFMIFSLSTAYLLQLWNESQE